MRAVSSTLNKIMIVIGTRPEIIKMSPLIREIKKSEIELILVHTGQHYDYELSQIFINSLKLPEISFNLNVGSSSHLEQLATIMIRLEDVIKKSKPEIVLAQGDTNSVLATSLACIKLGISFGHVEAGIRSFDMTMPEEVNRRTTSTISHLNFAPSERAVTNLLLERIDSERIHLTGNTIVDATLQNLDISKSNTFPELEPIYSFIGKEDFILCTIHRPSNVDSINRLTEIISAFEILSEHSVKIVFSMHPRTRSHLEKFNLLSTLSQVENVHICNPLDYLPFLQLMSKCSLILTDSGGIQEEAVTLKKRCITLRENTERPETIEMGLNELCPTESTMIVEKVLSKINSQENLIQLNKTSNPYGDGDSSVKILKIIKERIAEIDFKTPSFLQSGSPQYTSHQIEKTIELKVFLNKNSKIVVVFNELGNPIDLPKILYPNYTVVTLGE